MKCKLDIYWKISNRTRKTQSNVIRQSGRDNLQKNEMGYQKGRQQMEKYTKITPTLLSFQTQRFILKSKRRSPLRESESSSC
jgi:hypothetical protein